jgi:hypothetical protein
MGMNGNDGIPAGMLYGLSACNLIAACTIKIPGSAVELQNDESINLLRAVMKDMGV